MSELSSITCYSLPRTSTPFLVQSRRRKFERQAHKVPNQLTNPVSSACHTGRVGCTTPDSTRLFRHDSPTRNLAQPGVRRACPAALPALFRSPSSPIASHFANRSIFFEARRGEAQIWTKPTKCKAAQVTIKGTVEVRIYSRRLHEQELCTTPHHDLKRDHQIQHKKS